MTARQLGAHVRARAQHRCEYCRSPQRYVFGKLEIEHIIPKVADGTDDLGNLCLACRMCNGFKGAQTRALDPRSGRQVGLFNPRLQKWTPHFTWSEDGTQVIGRTAVGRATVAALRLNNAIAVMVRREWVAAGWHPPKE